MYSSSPIVYIKIIERIQSVFSIGFNFFGLIISVIDIKMLIKKSTMAEIITGIKYASANLSNIIMGNANTILAE
jgi:glucose uptake protein GlcU